MKKILLPLILLALPLVVFGQGTTTYPTAIDDTASLPVPVDAKVATLTVGLTSSGTTVTVNSTTGFSAKGIIVIESEQIAYTGTTGTTFTGLTRGFGGTTARPHSINVQVKSAIVAAHITGPRGAALALQAKLGTGASNAADADADDCLVAAGDGSSSWQPCAAGSGSGDVEGPASSVNNRIAQFDGTTGKLLEDSGFLMADLQPVDADLTAIGALSPSNDDVLQRKAGAWINRSISQLKTDLSLSGSNTGDQDLSGLVPNTRTVNGHPLSSNVTVTPTDLSLVIGTNVEAHDTDLTTIAGLSATTDNFLVAVASAWASRTPAQVKTTLSLDNVDNTSDATKNAASVTLTNKTLTSPVINVGSDATGDVYYRNSGGAFTRLGVGSNGQVLTLDAGLPSWATAGGSGPFDDGTAIIKGSADATKLLRIEVDGLTAGTTRVLTPQNASYTIAGLETSQIFTAAQSIASNSSSALAVGANGATNPAWLVDAATSNSATGVKVTSAAAGGNVTISAISSGADESLILTGKGSGRPCLGAAYPSGVCWFAGSVSLILPSASNFGAVSNGAFNIINPTIMNAANTGPINSGTAPTVSGFGTSPTVPNHAGNYVFTINVGTGGSASTGTINFPTAATGWSVHCEDVTTQSSTVFITKQTGGSTTTATIGNFNTSGAAAAWAASDILRCTARGY